MKHATRFFELIKISLGKQTQFLSAPTEEEWQELFLCTQKQMLIGVLFAGVQRLPVEQRPPSDLLLNWYGLTEVIKKQNLVFYKQTVEASNYFTKQGFDNCILKGLGVAALYPEPLTRISGDIDIWLDGGRERVFTFAAQKGKLQGVNSHHVLYPLFDHTEVELHVLPNRLNNPFLNRKLQRYFREVAPIQYSHRIELPDGMGNIPVPTTVFDGFYVLLHIYHHLFGEGVGLRQMMDYYYVLQQPMSEDEREKLLLLFNTFGMRRFAGATMYVMREVFGLEERFLLLEPDEREGRFLLDEILQAGNLGQYDDRSGERSSSAMKRFFNSMKRNARFLCRYPSEVLWNIPYRIYLYVWRKWKGYI